MKDVINKRLQIKSKRIIIPENRRLIDSKWVLKKIIYVWYRASLVAQGYTQIPGVDFTYNYSPVFTYITLFFILLVWLINKWDLQDIYVEMPFLFGVLEEEIYTRIPEVTAEVLE